jgi:hypothetical protein
MLTNKDYTLWFKKILSPQGEKSIKHNYYVFFCHYILF